MTATIGYGIVLAVAPASGFATHGCTLLATGGRHLLLVDASTQVVDGPAVVRLRSLWIDDSWRRALDGACRSLGIKPNGRHVTPAWLLVLTDTGEEDKP